MGDDSELIYNEIVKQGLMIYFSDGDDGDDADFLFLNLRHLRLKISFDIF